MSSPAELWQEFMDIKVQMKSLKDHSEDKDPVFTDFTLEIVETSDKQDRSF